MVPMIRMGEMYLIAAESCPAGLAGGVEYINALRSNRGVGNIQELTEDLLRYEYMRELYGEGQLFFMYKRMFAPVMFSSKANKNPQPSDAIFTVPVPDSETEN